MTKDCIARAMVLAVFTTTLFMPAGLDLERWWIAELEPMTCAEGKLALSELMMFSALRKLPSLYRRYAWESASRAPTMSSTCDGGHDLVVGPGERA